MPTVVTGKFVNSGRQWDLGEEVPDIILNKVPHHVQGLLFEQGVLRFMDKESMEAYRVANPVNAAKTAVMRRDRRIAQLKDKIEDMVARRDRDGYKRKEQQKVIDKLMAEFVPLCKEAGIDPREMVETEPPKKMSVSEMEKEILDLRAKLELLTSPPKEGTEEKGAEPKDSKESKPVPTSESKPDESKSRSGRRGK